MTKSSSPKERVKEAESLKRESFPHTSEKGRIRATIPNLAHLFKSYKIECQYNEVLKKQTI